MIVLSFKYEYRRWKVRDVRKKLVAIPPQVVPKSNPELVVKLPPFDRIKVLRSTEFTRRKNVKLVPDDNGNFQRGEGLDNFNLPFRPSEGQGRFSFNWYFVSADYKNRLKGISW